MYYILDDDYKPIKIDNIMQWAEWFQTANRTVAVNDIEDVRVSTVFLGIDHQFHSGDAPILWETMVFGGAHDGFQDRYTSYGEALKGHAAAVDLVEDALVKPNTPHRRDDRRCG